MKFDAALPPLLKLFLIVIMLSYVIIKTPDNYVFYTKS